jgi:hypothetical protein
MTKKTSKRRSSKHLRRNTQWDYDDLRNTKDKTCMLSFLPYLETPDGKEAEIAIGYRKRAGGYGYGRWEEFFRTLAEARKRMAYLIAANVVEDIELRKESERGSRSTTLVDEWNDGVRGQ